MDNTDAQIIATTTTNPTRQPFSDVSNANATATASSSSSSPLPSRNRNPKSNSKSKSQSKSKNLQPQPHPHDFLIPSQTQIHASSSTPALSHLHSDRADCNLLSMSEQTTVYRRKTTSRRENTLHATSKAALSCPPGEKKGKKSKKDDNTDTHRVISSAPCKRRKKPENFTLPEDFVREQRDYFAKLDEEELIVEEAEKEQFQFLDKSEDKVNQSEDG